MNGEPLSVPVWLEIFICCNETVFAHIVLVSNESKNEQYAP